MADPVNVLLVGIGGYGEAYLSALLDEEQGKRCKIVGAVDPEPARCSRLAELNSLGVPVYASFDLFFKEHVADLAIISSPLQLHAEHVEEALTHGCHVLVEKPAAASTKDIDRMIETRDRMERFVAVGYQWSFAGSILKLKQDILAGMFGAPKGGKCLTLWPRTDSYYTRNDWAGKERDAAGRPVFDSPANNAMAHFLHNMLFLLGPEIDRSVEPTEVGARLARANEILTFDTIAAKVSVTNGADLLFFASHAIGEGDAVEPRFMLEFEDAAIDFPGEKQPMTARFNDGTAIEYKSPYESIHTRKLWACVNAVVGGGSISCGLETARPHVQCIEMIHGEGAQVNCFPEEKIQTAETQEGQLRWVEGLAEAMGKAYEQGALVDFGAMG